VKLTPADSTDFGASYTSAFYDAQSKSVWMLRGCAGQPGGGLFQYSLNTRLKTFYNLPCYKNIPGHSHNAEAMCYDHTRNCLWINSSEGLVQFTLDNKQFHHINALNNLLNVKNYDRWVGISQDIRGRLWLATQPKGIVVYNPSNESVTFPFEGDTTTQKQIADFNSCIYCDRDGMVWFGFWLPKGIYQLVPYTQVVKHYTANFKLPGSLNSNGVPAIVPAGHNKLWVGTFWGGLNIFDTQTDSFKVWREKDLPGIKMKTHIVPVMIDTVTQKAWAFTDSGFFKIDMLTQKCQPVIYKNQLNQPIPALNELFPKASKKRLVVTGSYNNRQCIFVVNTNSNIACEVLSFPDNTFNPLFTIPAGEHLLFLKGRNELIDNQTYVNSNGKWKQKHTPIDSIEWSAVCCNEKDSSYWVAGQRKLFHFNKNFYLLQQYTEDDGVPEFSIESMMPDNKGNIWFNTDRSIHQLNILTNAISTLSEKDGFEKQNFSAAAVATKDAAGNIYFPGGLYGVGFDQVKPGQFIFPAASVYVRSLEINQQHFPLSATANNMQELSLRYFENNIAVETGVIDFYSRGKSAIRYKLQKVNDNWHYAPANYTIRYEALSPGNYTLVMQASNAGNEFNGPVKSMFISISPPFWKTWWFILLMVVLVAMAISSLFQFRLNQKMQVLKVRQKLHRDLHDDVGATLSSVKVYSEILQNHPDNAFITDLIKTNAADMIDRLEIIAWATNPQHDTFKSFKDQVNKYALATCYAKGIELTAQYDGVNENMIMPGDIRQNLFLIFKEAINNIIKYAAASQCNLKIGVKHHQLSFTISDNGKGSNGIIEGNGSGWKNMQQRSEEINGKLAIESREGEGTTVIINLSYPFKIPSFWDKNGN
jgi:signal transduction histidine kinase